MDMRMPCIILAGGQGKRMSAADKHKVCFPIAGRPAVTRAIDTYKAAGLRHFIVVVGQLARQVIATVCEAHPEVQFVFQAEPNGTGHAAAVAAEALAAQGYHGPVMVVMGDKVTTPQTVRKLLDAFDAGQADLVLTALRRTESTTAGRIVTARDGRVLGVVELSDIEHARRTGGKITLAGRFLAPNTVEKRSRTVNASMYVFDFAALRRALAQLRSDNVQGELYLTDTVESIARDGRVEAVLVENPDDLMAFNTPAELIAIEEVIRRREPQPRVQPGRQRRLSKRKLKPARQWLTILDRPPAELYRRLGQLYGRDETLIASRREAMGRVVKAFAKRCGGDREMILCRAPGRVNLMGRHVDHRGGYVNVMAISREVLLAAAPRDDDVVTLRNVSPKAFPPREFRVSDLMGEAGWADWMGFLASAPARREIEAARGDWSHYARAPLLRLQHECPHRRLRGFDCMVGGDIPMAAGLSSSSALVVAFAEAAVAVNALRVETRDFVDLCGEGEWFVGSRGGSADHAAIHAARAGCIARIGFFPFELAGQVRMPADLRVVIAHSGSTAVKSIGARDKFNQRVACYELAMMVLREVWPPAAGLKHLRDLTPDAMKLRPAEIYRALKLLPNRPSRRRLRQLLGERHRDRLDELFATHANIGGYDLRGVALYGICECVRSRRFAEAVQAGDLGRVGRTMYVSHDGDRVTRRDAAGRVRKHTVRTDDDALERLALADAEPAYQAGRYACSTDAVDHLVDLAAGCDGVIGAQLAGAGLGGCMMILVRRGATESLLRTLRRDFYRPRGLRPNALVCTGVAGAGLLSI